MAYINRLTKLINAEVGDTGDYIDDQEEAKGAQRLQITHALATSIMKELNLDVFHNKQFVCISRPIGYDKGIGDDLVAVVFLYKHDFTWYLYNID